MDISPEKLLILNISPEKKTILGYFTRENAKFGYFTYLVKGKKKTKSKIVLSQNVKVIIK